MSYSMSPPLPQKPAPAPYAHQTYAPVHNPSPTNPSSFAPPPAKRQRLSPDPRSPQQPYQNGAYHVPPSNHPGVSSYGNPYAPSPTSAVQSPYSPNTYASSPMNNSFNTPQPYPGAPQQQHQQWQTQQLAPPVQRAHAGSPPAGREMMPPPPRPNKDEKEERVGVDDFNDALYSSGINLKDEENYLHNLYGNKHTTADSFTTPQSSSFNSGTASANNSFSMLTQSFNSQSGTSAGTMGPTVSQESVDNERKRKREAAARAKAERDQHQLNNPFLLGNVVRQKLDKVARENGVSLDVNGLYILQSDTNRVLMNGDKSEGIVEAKAGSKIEQSAPFADVLSLVSLAAGERLRGLLDEAFSLARARRYGDHGRVPPDFSDIASGEGERKEEDMTAENITGTSWDKLPSDNVGDPQPTVSFQSTLNTRLRALAIQDQDAERERERKREKRRKEAEGKSGGELGPGASATEDTPMDNASTPLTASTAETPDAAADSKKPMSKKEAQRREKEAKNSASAEAAMATTTNQTAAMMALGRKGNRYSWMSGGVASMPTNRFAKASSAASGTATPIKREGARTPVGGKSANNVNGSNGGGDLIEGKEELGGMEWGRWRETGEGGKGIQVRDWLLVLERDGREKKALQGVTNRLR